MKTKGKKILGFTLGNCIHVAGIHRFMQLAESCGYEGEFAGACFSPREIIAAVKLKKPDMVALSYRLTPEVAQKIFTDLLGIIEKEKITGITWLFGGTPPVCEEAKKAGIFSAVFSGEETDEQVLRWLKGEYKPGREERYADNLLERIKEQEPFPLLRHHFGLPDLEETIEGVRLIAESKTVDIISIGPDQNAQECFFRPAEMDPSQDGAGGVPLRKAADLRRIYQASRYGNYPLLRIYSGTRDLIRWAELSVKELHNAWAAVPLYWYSIMDGRSRRNISEAIAENLETMAWYGKRGIPVEVNEAHHWSLRGAPDEVAVAAAFLAAYNAKKQGVRDFILQLMWNTPPQILPYQDLAKMLAEMEMVQSLLGRNFRVWRQVRAGLASLSPNMAVAKGQLAASTQLAMQINPHIIHVVGYCEGDHAARPEEVIESCQIVRGVLKNCLYGLPDCSLDERVQERKKELLVKAGRIIKEITSLSKTDDGLADPEILALAVRKGIMHAPQIMKEALEEGVRYSLNR